jgi:hypothetical protein
MERAHTLLVKVRRGFEAMDLERFEKLIDCSG